MELRREKASSGTEYQPLDICHLLVNTSFSPPLECNHIPRMRLRDMIFDFSLPGIWNTVIF